MLDFISNLDNEAFYVFPVTEVRKLGCALLCTDVQCLLQVLEQGMDRSTWSEGESSLRQQTITLLNCNYHWKPS